MRPYRSTQRPYTGNDPQQEKSMKTYTATLPRKYAGVFILGLLEHVESGFDSDGRTHATDQDWNEAYDHGKNAGDVVLDAHA